MIKEMLLKISAVATAAAFVHLSPILPKPIERTAQPENVTEPRTPT
jgi:hypothetical protein